MPMVFDIAKIERYFEDQGEVDSSSESTVYQAELDEYVFYNDLTSSSEFSESDWYEALTPSIAPQFSDEEKELIEAKLKLMAGEKHWEFVLSHCTVSEDGYDCWIMHIAFGIISQNANATSFISWFSDFFAALASKENYSLLQEATYGLWRVWSWHDAEQADELFLNLGIDVDELKQIDDDIDRAYAEFY